jgi:hypothetical protein
MRSDRIIELAAIAIFSIIFFGMISWGVQQQHDCETACSPSQAITPIVGGKNICLCDEGQGKWRRQELTH